LAGLRALVGTALSTRKVLLNVISSWFVPYAGIIAVIFSNIAGNLMLKAGAHRPGYLLLGFLSPYSVLGIGFFGLGILLYAWALRHVPLHIAQVMLSTQYIGVIVGAAVLLGEHIPAMRWVGIMLIAVGILISFHG
jgi:drug/metabolite transporter (DMT)-like permease